MLTNKYLQSRNKTGNVISICASFFLNAPWTQVKKMFAPTRRIATSVYLITLALTLIVALAPAVLFQGPLLVALVIVQFLSMIWYSLSYIPYAREYAATACGTLCGTPAGG
jgi:putative flippase GtrA